MLGSRRIALGPLAAAAGAVLLAVSLFLDWYDDVTAFTVFEVLDLALLALAATVLLSLAEGAGLRLPGSPLASRHALPLAVVALVIVLSQLVNEPPAIVQSEHGPETGLWLGVAGAALMVAGALLAITRISLAVDVERRAAGRPTVEPGGPAVEADRPAAVDPDAPTERQPPEPY